LGLKKKKSRGDESSKREGPKSFFPLPGIEKSQGGNKKAQVRNLKDYFRRGGKEEKNRTVDTFIKVHQKGRRKAGGELPRETPFAKRNRTGRKEQKRKGTTGYVTSSP